MGERPWETMLRTQLGDAWERTQDDVTSLVAELQTHWPDVLDPEVTWTATAELVLDLLGRDDEVHDLLRSVLTALYGVNFDIEPHCGRHIGSNARDPMAGAPDVGDQV